MKHLDIEERDMDGRATRYSFKDFVMEGVLAISVIVGVLLYENIIFAFDLI